ncbi:hypothetical protein [Brevundimonas sp.]|uniref:hypothetical protein n=1 Tax=Brevundimonas sp. TaxID=1871086 RepID=UPI002D290E39|nr:hypothetical protein [Brevundimonas sp.]HYC99393.1 hypothetical protein [Brevundimonas sp.]
MLVTSALAALAMTAVQEPPQDPEQLQRLLACRAMPEATARLACFDAAAGALETAHRDGSIVMIDRAGMDRARRETFGLDLAALPRLFGSRAGPELADVETTLVEASRNPRDIWTFRLADGSTWIQIDSGSVQFRNRPGQPVHIRRAAMGSFMMTVGNSRSIRVRRQ